MSGFWDDPSIKPSNGTYMKFESVGDSVEGTIAHLDKHTFDDGKVAVKIRFAEPDKPVLTAGQVMLKTALHRLRPIEGDSLSIELVAVQKKGTGTLKLFRVMVTRSDGTTDVVDQST